MGIWSGGHQLCVTQRGAHSLTGSAPHHQKRNLRRSLSAEGRAWWCTDVVHLIYSALSFAAAAVYVARHPAALSVLWKPSPSQAGLLPDLLVCTSAGFFGFQLWTLVRNR